MRQQESRRIAYLCLETPREGQAASTHVHEIVNGLKARGWNVELTATSQGGASAGDIYVFRVLDYIAAQWRLIRKLGAVDAVYMRAHFAALPASIWAALRGKPVIQEINGKPQDILVTYPWLAWLGWLVKASYRWQLRLASRVIVVTEGLRQWCVAEAGHERVSLIPNGANVDLFTPQGDRPADMGDYVAFVGGLVAWHGIATMLAALQSPSWPECVRLVVIGDGVERTRLEAARAHPRLVWLGRKPYGEVPAYLRGALAALCIIEDPDGRSATGVAPLKLFEAMACGTAVIATELPFQADIVRREGAGVVIPVADAHALARAVAELANDQSVPKAMGMRGAAYVRQRASWAARAHATGCLIAEAIDLGSDRTRQ
jgi:glycosyltransferase involved in cell wall biosynthesis